MLPQLLELLPMGLWLPSWMLEPGPPPSAHHLQHSSSVMIRWDPSLLADSRRLCRVPPREPSALQGCVAQ